MDGCRKEREVLPLSPSPTLFFSPACIRDIFPAFCLRWKRGVSGMSLAFREPGNAASILIIPLSNLYLK